MDFQEFADSPALFDGFGGVVQSMGDEDRQTVDGGCGFELDSSDQSSRQHHGSGGESGNRRCGVERECGTLRESEQVGPFRVGPVAVGAMGDGLNQSVAAFCCVGFVGNRRAVAEHQHRVPSPSRSVFDRCADGDHLEAWIEGLDDIVPLGFVGAVPVQEYQQGRPTGGLRAGIGAVHQGSVGSVQGVPLYPAQGKLRSPMAVCLRLRQLAVPLLIATLASSTTAAPPRQDSGFEKGVRLSKSGRLAEAESIFRQLVRSQPRNAGAWGNLGLVLMRRGRWADARRAFSEAWRLEPSTPDFAAQASMAALRSGDYSGAETLARRAVAKEPGNTTALSALAGSLLSRNRPAEAVGVLRTLDTVRRGSDPGVVRSLLTAMAMAGGLPDAVAECRRRLPKWKTSGVLWGLFGDLTGQLGADRKDLALLNEARNAYSKAYALDPRDVRSGVNAAQAAEMAGAIAQARALYGAVLRRHPGNAAAHYGLGRLLLSDMSVPEPSRAMSARPHFEAALAAEPRNPDYAVALGFALGLSGSDAYPSAIATLRAALSIAPKDGRARRGLVDFLVKSGDRTGALAEQRRLVADEPDDKEAYQRLAGILRTMGRDAQAWDALRAMAKRFPADPLPLKELGLLLEQAGKLPESEQALRDALSRAPKDADLLTSLGLVIEKAGRRSEAIGRFRDAIVLSPGNEAAHVALITALAASGDASATQAAREAWVAADPSNNRARWDLAQAYMLQRDDVRALEQMRSLEVRAGDPMRRTYLLGPASLLVARERWDEALAEYRRVMVSDKSDAVRVGYAEVLEKAGRLVDARRELETLVGSSKEPVPVRVALSGLLERSGAPDDAARVWEDLASTHPSVSGLVENLVRIRRSQGREADAWSTLERAALSGSGPPPVPFVRAFEKESSGSPERIVEFTRRLTEAFPGDRGVWTSRVDALLKGMPGIDAKRLAADAMARIGRLDPKDSEVEFRRGRLLEEIGDRAGAVAAYRESARRRPGGPASAVLRAMGLETESKPKGPGKL